MACLADIGVHAHAVATQASPGNLNTHGVKVHGTSAGIERHGDDPEERLFASFAEPARTIVRGGPATTSEAARVPDPSMTAMVPDV